MSVVHLLNNDNQFYPTPPYVANKLFSMLEKEKSRYKNILEPSAGKGDLIKLYVDGLSWSEKRMLAFHCCEIDKNLCNILYGIQRDEGDFELKIVGNDFLEFQSIENYDLIIMNPPFKNGDKHLLHALNYVINGEILCVLNAETLKNPFSNSRKLLNQKLKDLNATITYESNAFLSLESERKTDVEVALIHIVKKQNVDDIFGVDYEKEKLDVNLGDGSEVKNVGGNKSIDEMLEEYQDYQRRITKTCIDMFKASYGCRELFSVNVRENNLTIATCSISNAQETIRVANSIIKKRYWDKLLNRDEFKNKLTSKSVAKFYNIIKKFSDMEFSRNNINVLCEYILDNGAELFKTSIFELFDEITRERSWYPELNKNVYLFNGWKSNNGYKINKRFILIKNAYPQGWSLDYSIINQFNDIEKIFVYFNNGIYPEIKLSDALNVWAEDVRGGTTSNNFFENDMFKVRIFKKGTVHFYVKDDNLLRRFNVFVGKERAWLPPDYAMKKYSDCSEEEKNIIEEFEGKEHYKINSNNQSLIGINFFD